MKAIRLIIILFCHSVCSYAQQENIEKAEPDTCVHLEEVCVAGFTGSSSIRKMPIPVNVISNEALQVRQSTNIVDALSRQPGISQITTGSSISKPVIRGLGYNRVLVVANGLRQEGQQWGDEHGIELDGNAVHAVEIQKGPASLMYGSDAMAGVIIMRDAPTMPVGAMYAEAGTEYQTNNGLFAYTLNYRGNEKGFVWNWRWSQKWAHDYEAPEDGYVKNSRFKERSLNGMLGLDKSWGFSHLKMSYYNLTPGMTEVEDGYEPGGEGYAVEAPFQQVRHYKSILDNSVILGDGVLKAIIGYQQNRRQEFEEADECGLDLRLHSANYDFRYVMPEWRNWKSNVGVGGMYQYSENLGDEFLVPDYKMFDVGSFVTISRSFLQKTHLSGGVRYDYRHLHAYALEEERVTRFADFSRDFKAFSGSLGVIYNFNEHLDLKANVSRGFRAPNISELGSNGQHEGTFRYEKGNERLDPEYSWQYDMSADFASELFSTSVALFANYIDNFIYLRRSEGEIDGSPIYQFSSGKARIMGGEARLIFHLLSHLHFENNFSYVDARQLEAEPGQCYLPFTPAPRWLSTLHYDVSQLKLKVLKKIFVELESDYNFRQDHIMSANDTERPTSDYLLLNFSLGTNVHLSNGKKICSINLSANNLLNQAYQSHLSRLKYAETAAFTGREGINNMGRNIGVKLLFPLELSHD